MTKDIPAELRFSTAGQSTSTPAVAAPRFTIPKRATGSAAGKAKEEDFPYSPTQLPGWEGAFCRVYSPIEEAIMTFLGDIYIAEKEGRYRYFKADSEGGLVICPDGQHAVSYHTNTDPAADGKARNAYQLVRLHLFEDNDRTMQAFCSRIPALREDLHRIAAILQERKGLHNFIDPDPDNPDDMGAGDRLFTIPGLDYTKEGTLRVTVDNCARILERDPDLKGNITYDLMGNGIFAERGLPWYEHTHSDCRRERAPWCDHDLDALVRHLSLHYGIDATAKITTALGDVVRRHSFHPVREYLEGLSWDGTPRIDTMIIDCLGSEDCPTTREMTRLMMIAAVARVYNPGVKYDYMTILFGRQGTFKSSLCNILFGDRYCDSFHLSEGKDGLLKLRGQWGVELAELAGLRKSEIEEIRTFISMESDKYRDPYGRCTNEYPRQFVLLGTTNDTHFLRDEENRRFAVIPIDATLRKHANPRQTLLEMRDQLWAEAYHIYLSEGWADRPLILSPEATQEQIQRNLGVHVDRIDPLRQDLEDYLSRPIPHNWEAMNAAQRHAFYCGQGEVATAEERATWRQRQTFSVKAFLIEYYGYSNEAEAKSRNRFLRGDIAKRIAAYLREFGGWSDKPARKYTSYGRVLQYDRVPI